MIIGYILVALFISWIWVHYYRSIDIYERDSLIYFLMAFLMGCASVVFVFVAHAFLLNEIGWRMHGGFFNDLMYCIFQIGLLEEVAKFIPFFIMLKMLPKVIDEPVDYLSFAATCALGFAAVENVMYFTSSGPEIISGRAVLSVIGHMTWTVFVAYGFMRQRYKKPKPSIWEMFGFLMLAATAHGIYDFALMWEGFKGPGYFLAVIFYLLCISAYATMLNNALNNSPHFHYSQSIESWTVALRIVGWYFALFLLQSFLVFLEYNTMRSFQSFFLSIFTTGFIIAMAALRLSRFRLIRGEWFRVRFNFPINRKFSLSLFQDYNINIRGDSPAEIALNGLIGKQQPIRPFARKKVYLRYQRNIEILEKIFLKDHDSMYVAKVYNSSGNQFEMVLLRPRVGKSFIADTHPIVAVHKIDGKLPLHPEKMTHKQFQFLEYGVILIS
ncbi:MAG: PrsW family intramembrane metalloprotease [Flavobacteriales bacterium]|nr:PrsW family intramembrane metalloprotease [Flavobacteriales bacterium]